MKGGAVAVAAGTAAAAAAVLLVMRLQWRVQYLEKQLVDAEAADATTTAAAVPCATTAANTTARATGQSKNAAERNVSTPKGTMVAIPPARTRKGEATGKLKSMLGHKKTVRVTGLPKDDNPMVGEEGEASEMGAETGHDGCARTTRGIGPKIAVYGPAFQMEEIGRVHSPFPHRAGTPRQGLLAPHARSFIRLHRTVVPTASLEGLQRYSHVWVIFRFHINIDRDQKVRNKCRALTILPDD